MNVKNFLHHQFKRWVFFNLLTFPVIAAVYVPYNIFWLNYTGLQMLKWLLTSGLMAAGFNIFFRPWTVWVVHYLDRKLGKTLNDSDMPSTVEDTLEVR